MRAGKELSARSLSPRHWLDRPVAFLTILCLGIGLTGGGTLRLARAKVEFSSLDPWMLALGTLAWIRFRLTGTAAPVWRRWVAFWEAMLREPARASRWAFWGGLAVFGALWVGHGFRHWAFQTHGLDMAYTHQSIFHAWAGGPIFGASTRLLHCDVCISGTYLGEHLALSLLIFAPVTQWVLGALESRDLWVFALQVLIAAGSVAWVLRQNLRGGLRALSLAALLLVLANRGLRAALIWDFREDLLAFAGLLLGSAFLVHGRRGAAMAWFFFAMLSKENVALITPFVAVPLLLDPEIPLSTGERRRLAGGLVALSMAYAVLGFKGLMPLFNPYAQDSQQIAARFPGMGKSAGEVVLHLLTSPRAWWDLVVGRFFQWTALKYVLLLLGPTIWVCRRSPWWLVPAVPGIVMNLAGAATQRSHQFHYDLVILPFVVMGTLQGLRLLARLFPAPEALARQVALACFVALALSGRWPGQAITAYWPKSKWVQDSLYLASLQGSQVTAASWTTLPQLTQLPHLRAVSLPPPGPREEVWQAVRSANAQDVSRIPERFGALPERWVLDRHNPVELSLETELLQRGWRQISGSPSGRFSELVVAP